MKRPWQLPVKRGCRHPLARFRTPEELEELREFVRTHPYLTLRMIAARYDCSHLCIYRVLKKMTYDPPT